MVTGQRAGRFRLRRAKVVAVAMAMLVLLGAAGGPPSPAYADPDPTSGKLLLLLDSSGSMAEPDGTGTSKIKAARSALTTVVNRLHDSAQVGMRVYGQSRLSKPDPRACRDTRLVVAVGAHNKANLVTAIQRYSPAGETPIAYSLQRAVEDLGTEGQRTILLVSDGQETCNRDPCKVARAITSSGVLLKIDVVGFRVSGKARRQLQCIAQVARGDYYDADSTGDLLASLDRLATRAFRPFRISGRPVEGRPDRVGAPEITVGTYPTHLGGLRDKRYYLVGKTPGTSLHVSVAARPVDDRKIDGIFLTPQTADGETCGDIDSAATVGNFNDRQELLVGSLLVDPADPDDQPCVDADRMLIELSRNRGGTDVLDVELGIVEEPAVRNIASLPPALHRFEVADLSGHFPGGKPERVIGGSSFPDATTLTPGVYSDGILPGEALVYRVPVGFGQRLQTFVKVPRPTPALARAFGGSILNSIEIDDDVYTPTLAESPGGYGTAGVVSATEGSTFGVDTPEVRYRNRESEDYDIQHATVAGNYYIVITAARNARVRGAVIPFQLAVTTVGAPHGRPDYAPVTTPSSAPSATKTAAPPGSTPAPTPAGASPSPGAPDAGTTRWPVVLAVAGTAGVLGLLAAGLLGWRHRRRL